MAGSESQDEIQVLTPDELMVLIDDTQDEVRCLIAQFMLNKHVDYRAQLSRLLDARREHYPVSGQQAAALLRATGIDRSTTTVRQHRSGRCSDCQQIFDADVVLQP